MSDLIARLKDRKFFTPIIETETTIADEKFTFKIARFSHAENECALSKAAAMVGTSVDSESKYFELALEGALTQCLSEYIKFHVKGFIHHPKEGVEPLKYEKSILAELFQAMTLNEKRQLVLSYQEACRADEKKILQPEQSQTDSES